MEKAEINSPNEDIEIGYSFSGSILCRHLTILSEGSVTGSVVAERIDVKGALSGVADCEHFRAIPPAVVRGTVFAPNYHTRDRDGRDADAVVLHLSTRQPMFRMSPREPLPVIDEVINEAIDEAVADLLASSGTSNSPSVEATFRAVEQELTLTDRLAAKGLSSLIPAAQDVLPPHHQDVDEPRSTTSTRMPLPSLV